MIETRSSPNEAADLRNRAEEQAKADETKTRATLSPKESRQLLHELRVHQIELEMQNEELRRTQAELETARARYFDLYDLAPVGYFTVSKQGLILEANLTAAGLLGVTRGALLKQPLTRSIVPADQDLYYRHRKQLFETGAPQGCELRLVKKDGAPFWAQMEATTAQDAEGVTVCRVVISDITERKRAEQTQARLVAILDATPDFVGFADARDGHIYYINPAGRKMVGVGAQEDVTRLKIADVHPEWTNKLFRDEIIPTAIRDGVWTGECAFLNRDGREIPVLMVLLAHKSPSGEVERFSTVSRDVTERKRAEEALHESEARYRALFESAAEGILVADLEARRLKYANPAICKMLGYSEEELMRLGVADIHPKESLGHVAAEFEAQTRGERTLASALPCLRKDGTVFYADVVATCAVIDGRPCLIGFFTDVTDRRNLEEQLRQAQKMEAVGRLAGGVAHDFNNLLTVIGGNAELAASTPQLPPDAHRHLSEITQATERAAHLTRQLLAFSRRQALEPRVVSLNDVLSNMDKMLRRLIAENIEFTTRPAKDLWAVCVDVGQIEQVVVNLAVNARDAMPDGGRLVLETANADLDEEYARSHSDVTPGHYVMLVVSDTGVGMANEVKERIFEPFFTTKEMGKGTGLGLPTCYGIVKQSGGHIWVYSEPGKGTTFKIYLPRVEKEPGALPRREDTADLPPGGNETILLVEDDASVRAVASRILRDQGYTVLEAGNGEEALHVARRAPGKTIHLVLTDVVMPEMGGKELSQRLKALRPSVKVLFASGYTETAVVRNSAFEPGFALLQKPFTKIALARKVREALDS